MRVLIGGFGTRGDVQPMVVLAQTLMARGHQVTCAVSPNSMPLTSGFELLPVGMSYQEVSRRTASGKFIDSVKVVPFVRDELTAQLEALEARAEQADVIVGSSVFTIGAVLSAKLKRPYVYSTFCPMLIPSASHPSPVVKLQNLPRWANRATWWLNRLSWNLLLLKTLNAALRTRGLAPVRDAWASLIGDHPLIACDPALAVVPSDYRVPVAQVGALFHDDPGALSKGTEAFLSAGAPPVYVGFGSMSDPHPEVTTARLISAVRAAGFRALISRGWAGLTCAGAGDDVHFAESEPHSRLFGRCAAIVHHGGSGTTHAASGAGVPQVVMPQILDQHYWAKRVHLAGIGVSVPRYTNSAAPLTDALKACTTEPMRSRSRAVGASMKRDGALRAAELLESLDGRRGARQHW